MTSLSGVSHDEPGLYPGNDDTLDAPRPSFNSVTANSTSAMDRSHTHRRTRTCFQNRCDFRFGCSAS